MPVLTSLFLFCVFAHLRAVLRLKNHPDAPSAARAFDRAALCLARAGMGSKNPELNFPVQDYEGELLPDLKGACVFLVSLVQ